MGATTTAGDSEERKRRIAFITEGQLWIYRHDDESTEQVRSKYAIKLKEDLLKIHQRNEWKNQGAGALFSGSGAMWSSSMFDPESMSVAFTALAGDPSESDQIYYVIQTADICGLFQFNLASGEENRLFHGADKSVHALDANADDESLVCSISSASGLHNLALFRPRKGGGLQEITEGDSLDAYPRWVPGKKQVVFQTAGIGRNRYGDWVETAPCEIALLDFNTGDIQTLYFQSPSRPPPPPLPPRRPPSLLH